MLIKINGNLGMTIDNMPDSIFSIISGGAINELPGGGLSFNVRDDLRQSVISLIRSFSDERGYHAFLRVPEQGQIEFSRRDRLEAEEDEVIAEDDEELEEDEDEEELEAEMDNGHEPPRNQEGFRAGIVPVSEVQEDEIVRGNEVVEAIAGVMENELSNQAKELSDRVRAFDKKWAALVAEKRAIDEATMAVSENPIIRNLIDQVEELRTMDNLIEDIYFTKDSIVAKTKTLITGQRIDGHLREIGKMKFIISLSPFVGSASKSERPIIIKNLTRKYHQASGSVWECAHVKYNGESICWGNAWEMLFSSFSSRDLHSVIEILIRFVTTPNTSDSWGQCAKHFPEYRVERPENNNTTEPVAQGSPAEVS